MKKSIIAVVVVALVVAGVLLLNKKGGQTMKFETSEDMSKLIEDIYAKSENDLFGLETREIELDDEYGVSSSTGLTSADKLAKVVVSESMITSRAYSLTLVKVKDGADVEAIKQEMVNGVDMRKWICVCADVVYATNHGDLIFLVMASEDLAKPQYDAFKEIVGGKVGKELVREAEEIEFDF